MEIRLQELRAQAAELAQRLHEIEAEIQAVLIEALTLPPAPAPA